jgi:hypothetical protein
MPRCTDGTAFGPDLIFSKINMRFEQVVRAASSRRPSASEIEHRHLTGLPACSVPLADLWQSMEIIQRVIASRAIGYADL